VIADAKVGVGYYDVNGIWRSLDDAAIPWALKVKPVSGRLLTSCTCTSAKTTAHTVAPLSSAAVRSSAPQIVPHGVRIKVDDIVLPKDLEGQYRFGLRPEDVEGLSEKVRICRCMWQYQSVVREPPYLLPLIPVSIAFHHLPQVKEWLSFKFAKPREVKEFRMRRAVERVRRSSYDTGSSEVQSKRQRQW
jgi:hypothetical protein